MRAIEGFYGIIVVCTFDKGLVFGEHTIPLLERLVTIGASRIESLRLMRTIEDLNKRLREKFHERGIKLNESEERFKQFFENEPAYCYMISPESVILDVNKAALKALGYKKEELVGKHLKTIYAPESLPQMKENLEEWRKTGMLKDVEMNIITKKGERRTVLLSASAVKDRGGKPLHSVSVQKDITVRKKAEEALVESESRYRTLFEKSPDSVTLVDKSGIIIDCNKSTEKLIGYSKKEILGKPFDKLLTLDPKDLPKLNEIFKKLSDGLEVEPYELEIIRKGGEKRWINFTCSLLLKDDVGFQVISRDITERKQMGAALQESEEKFRNVFNYSNDGIFLHDLEGKVIDINQKGLDKLGYSRSEALSLNVANLHPPEALEGSKEAFEKIASEGFVQFEIDFKRKNGEIFQAEVSSSLFEIDGKKVIQGIVRDITERKQAEEALRESEEKYRSLVELANDGVIITQEGKLKFANAMLAKQFGYTVEEIIDTNFLDYVFPDDRPKVLERHNRRVRGEDVPSIYEMRVLRKDGRSIYIEINSGVITYKGKPAIFSFVRDITERKQAEEELRNRVQELSALNMLSHVISTNLSIDLLVKAALEEISATISPDLLLLFLREDNKLLLQGYNARSPRFQHETTPVHIVGECMCGLAVSEGKSLYSKDIRNDPRCTWEECKKAGLISFAALPLFSKDKIIGVLGLASGTERDFEERAAFLETLSSEIAIGLKNALLYEDVRQHSVELNKVNVELRAEITGRKKAEEKLHEKIDELEKWQRLSVGREVRMTELKEEIKKLKEKIKE